MLMKKNAAPTSGAPGVPRGDSKFSPPVEQTLQPLLKELLGKGITHHSKKAVVINRVAIKNRLTEKAPLTGLRAVIKKKRKDGRLRSGFLQATDLKNRTSKLMTA